MSLTEITSNLIYFYEGTSGAWNYSFDDQNWIPITSYPVKINNANTLNYCIVHFKSELTRISSNHYFIFGTEKIRVEGGNNRIIPIDIDSNGFNVIGLFQNGTSTIPGHSDIEIKDLISYNYTNITMTPEHGYFLQNHFGKSAINIKISNLINYGNINNNFCGGIGGANICLNGGIQVNNCVNYGNVGTSNDNVGCGGIFASNFLINNQASSSVENCINFGEINSTQSGGIFARSFYIGNSVIVSKCINFGNINGQFSAGIISSGIRIELSTISYTGILFELTNCYNVGNLNTNNTSGIINHMLSEYNVNNTNIFFKISNCYNTGTFGSFNNVSGIVGRIFEEMSKDINYDFLIIENCYNLSNILNVNQTGILGLYNTGPLNIKLKIKNCYSVTNSNTQNAIHNSAQTNIGNLNLENNNTTTLWDDSVAQITLINIARQNNNFNNYNISPSVITWIQTSPSTPYILSCFNTSIYDSIYNNKLVGEIIYANGPVPMATYSLVGKNSEKITFDEINNFIQIESDAPVGTYKIIIHQVLPDSTYNTMLVTITVIAICFGENTLLPIVVKNDENKCKIIYKRIQEISVGEFIMTEYHGPKKIKYIYKEKIQNVQNHENQNKLNNKLYVLKKEQFPALIEDLVLTGNHPILVKLNNLNMLEMSKNPEKYLRNYYRLETYKNKKAEDYNIDGIFNIYNVILENNNKYVKYPIRINGILSESCEEYNYHKYMRKTDKKESKTIKTK